MSKELLIKLASSLQQGSAERRNILAAARRFQEPTVFHFRKKALESLWNEEILGQISDGYFAGRARIDYFFWKTFKTTVSGRTEITGPTYVDMKTNLNLQAPGLLEVAEDRMLEIIHETEPDATRKDLLNYLGEIRKAIQEFGKRAKEEELKKTP